MSHDDKKLDYNSLFSAYIVLSLLGAGIGIIAARLQGTLMGAIGVGVLALVVGFAFRVPQSRTLTFFYTLQLATMTGAVALIVSMGMEHDRRFLIGHALTAAVVTVVAAASYLVGRVAKRRRVEHLANDAS